MMANIKDHPFWKKRSLLTDIDSRHLFKIKKYNTAIRNFANDPANAERLQEFTKKHRQNFADEIICRTPEENNDENICEREERRQRYIAELIPKLFGEGLVARSLKMGFDEDTAKQLHVIIGKDNIDGAGNYRTNEVKPAYCSYLYLESSQ
ncbi:hypothetical protein QE152_g19915 [Popillia japonica]|uniref:Uncharacterized protein n=1 Tax=Popillia japonica TaxID=7064 RepID=A0AAW1KPM8_POPJA